MLRLASPVARRAGISALPATVTARAARSSCAPLGASRLASSSSGDSIDFGFRQVPVQSKQALVHDVFARVAHNYDVMNDAMSGGMHRLWKYDLVQQLRPAPNAKHLDVAGGTGDIAFRVLMAAHAEAPPPAYRTPTIVTPANADPMTIAAAERAAYDAAAQVVVCDINDNMLRVGIDRARTQYGYEPGALIKPAVAGAAAEDAATTAAAASSAAPVSPALPVEQLSAARIYAQHGKIAFVSGNAECLPFESNSFDSYTIVFGLRNVTHRDRALAEALRVLRPGGRFLCMEFSAVTVPVLDRLYQSYSQLVIPALGQLIASDRDSYQYLVESIAQMPNQEKLADMVRRAGFVGVDYRNLTGGIVAIHQGFKPAP